MNEIDKKLRDRIKMLEDIDQMIQNPIEDSISYTVSRGCLDRSNLSQDYDFPLQTRKESKMFSTKEYTEPVLAKNQTKIKPVSYKSTEKSYSSKNKIINPKDKNIYTLKKNETADLKKSKQEKIKNKGSPIRNQSKNLSPRLPSNKKSTKATSKSPAKEVNINISINSYIPKSDVVERLYNHAFYQKQKMERKRQESEAKILKQMNPEITDKAKNIRRDSKKFFERLYPSHKIPRGNIPSENNINYMNLNNTSQFNDSRHGTPQINVNVNMNNNSFYNYTPYFDNAKDEDENFEKIYRRATPEKTSNFQHKPKINNNSLRIARNLTPSKERLLSKKTKKCHKENCPCSLSHVNTSFPSPTYKTLDVKKSISRSPSIRLEDLYTKGLEKMKKREIKCQEKVIKDGQEFRKYSYRPSINDYYPNNIGRKIKKPQSKSNLRESNDSQTSPKSEFYDKSTHWLKNVCSRKEKIKQNIEKEMKSIYTFQPKITKTMMPNDEKFIVDHLDQIEDYVSRRRAMLQKKKEEEDYLKKKFVTGENYRCKATVPKEFQFQTDIRGKSHSRDNSFDKNSRHSHNRAHRTPSQINLKLMRNELKTNEFFQKSGFFSDDEERRGDNSHCDSRIEEGLISKKIVNYWDEPEDQKNMQIFMSAINNLHDQLVNFKI
jgi:hypothetical protein